jgi:hypothetical protein
MILSSKIGSISNATFDADIFIHALGYEERSSTMLKSDIARSAECISLVFQGEERLSFRRNLETAQNRKTELVYEFLEFFRFDFVAKLNARGKKPKVVADISSMNRTMIAAMLFALLRSRAYVESVHLIYVPGQFKEPRTEFPAIEQIGAVIPELSGFDADPELPVGVVMGLGYEYGLAVGLINRLEPRLTVCFRAIGQDKRYDEACRRANLDFDFGYNSTELGSYPLVDAAAAYNHIENVVYGMTKAFRVVMVPLGPKIFAALATLISIKYIGTVAMWRVAAKLEVLDVVPSKEFIQVELDLTSELPAFEMDRALGLIA